jgi:hypothetical protein
LIFRLKPEATHAIHSHAPKPEGTELTCSHAVRLNVTRQAEAAKAEGWAYNYEVSCGWN